MSEKAGRQAGRQALNNTLTTSINSKEQSGTEQNTYCVTAVPSSARTVLPTGSPSTAALACRKKPRLTRLPRTATMQTAASSGERLNRKGGMEYLQ